jgi:hypothetical protein
MAVKIRIVVLWVMTLYSLVNGYQRFGVPHCLNHPGNVSLPLSWRWRQYTLPKRWFPSTILQSVITHVWFVYVGSFDFEEDPIPRRWPGSKRWKYIGHYSSWAGIGVTQIHTIRISEYPPDTAQRAHVHLLSPTVLRVEPSGARYMLSW